jgi:penicillin-binding protein-related factor A (putative recombinase)
MLFTQQGYFLANTNDGKALEGKLQETLKTFASKQRGFNHRFPDTRTARSGIIPSQPGDYMLLVPGKAILIEAKSTITEAHIFTLAHKNKVQIAQHRKWHRSCHPSLYLWMDLKHDIIEFHDGRNIVEKVDKPLFVGKSKDMLSALKKIVEDLT